MSHRNWSQYNASLVQRGSLTFFCHPSVAKQLRKAQRSQARFGRPQYSDQILVVLMLLKISYGLSYRGCEGMAISIFAPHSVKVPSYSTLCRGVRRLASCLPKLSRRRPKKFLLDSSGFKIFGEGEWKVKVHGPSYHRSWLKVHLVVDSESNEIVDLIVTSSSEADYTVGLVLLSRISKEGRELLADGAYDGEEFRRKAYNQGVTAIVPPPKHAIK